MEPVVLGKSINPNVVEFSTKHFSGISFCFINGFKGNWIMTLVSIGLSPFSFVFKLMVIASLLHSSL
jgi:hypothetical protein